MEQLYFSALEQPLFLLALQLIAFVLIICIVYGILYNTILKLNMPKWTAHAVATVFSSVVPIKLLWISFKNIFLYFSLLLRNLSFTIQERSRQLNWLPDVFTVIYFQIAFLLKNQFDSLSLWYNLYYLLFEKG